MFGLRNPWKFSFDRSTNDMWIGDVGQDKFEEIDFARTGNQAGANWGWNLREGKHPYNGGARPRGSRDPIFERSHATGDCAIIGGYVYRGAPALPLVGAYVFGDECTGALRAIARKAMPTTSPGSSTSSSISFTPRTVWNTWTIRPAPCTSGGIWSAPATFPARSLLRLVICN